LNEAPCSTPSRLAETVLMCVVCVLAVYVLQPGAVFAAIDASYVDLNGSKNI
jgi:hypothetical protein